MTRACRTLFAQSMFVRSAVVATAAILTPIVHAQPNVPNPYRLVENWPQLPANMNGGKFGEVIGVKPGPDGGIWVLHRCFNTLPAGSATCVGRDDMPPVLKFAPSGKLLESGGHGKFAFPHGFHIDNEGNVWATDANLHK